MDLIVSEINVFPIKSCAGISPNQAKITSTGFEHDREWMVVNEQGWFITQRQYPRMALIKPTLTDKGVAMTAPEMPKIEVAIPNTKDAAKMSVRIWDDTVEAVDQGDAVAEWLSQFLGKKCRLVRIIGKRELDTKYQVGNGESVAFPDGFPFLLASQASLDDLNSRMEKPVPMSRFRPNIVISGGQAFQEDEWKRIRISNTIFRVSKPCSRCEITTIDQKTATKDVEPLETLGTYRYKTKGIMFCQNLVHEGLGTIKVGDKVEVLA